MSVSILYSSLLHVHHYSHINNSAPPILLSHHNTYIYIHTHTHTHIYTHIHTYIQVPLLTSLPPLQELSQRDYDGDAEEDELELARIKAQRQADWDAEYAALEETISVATLVNTQRFQCARPALYAVIMLACEDKARALLSSGEGRFGSVVKVLLSMLESAFFDPQSVGYRKAKQGEIDHERSQSVVRVCVC